MTYTIIVAAGAGKRFGSDIPKQFLPLGSERMPVLMHTIRAFIDAGQQAENIRLVLSPSMTGYWQELCDKHGFASPQVVKGGRTRFHSVKNALKSIQADICDTILVHDGARPLVSRELIRRVGSRAAESASAIPVVPVTDSLRKLCGDATLGSDSVSVNRSDYVAVQTPQGFAAGLLTAAYNTRYDPKFTDDASVVAADGNHINLVEGEPDNIKITTPRDLIVAEALLNAL